MCLGARLARSGCLCTPACDPFTLSVSPQPSSAQPSPAQPKAAQPRSQVAVQAQEGDGADGRPGQRLAEPALQGARVGMAAGRLGRQQLCAPGSAGSGCKHASHVRCGTGWQAGQAWRVPREHRLRACRICRRPAARWRSSPCRARLSLKVSSEEAHSPGCLQDKEMQGRIRRPSRAAIAQRQAPGCRQALRHFVTS